MIIREVTKEDIPAWLTIAHESDNIIALMVPDIAVFYTGFKDYIARKMTQHEAYLAMDIISSRLLGIIAFFQKR